MDAADRSVRRASDQLQELADEITDPVNQWQLVAVWRSRALAALQRAPGLDSTWSERFETVVENLALPAPSLAEDWDIYEFEGRFHEARGVLIEAAESLRAQVETNEAAHAERTDGLTRREVTKLVNQYIGVSGGYLGDFSYRTHAEFYPEFCDLNIDTGEFEGTTRQRFIKILQSQAPRDQAKILRGVIERFPIGQDIAPETRTEEYRDELLRIIGRLETTIPVAGPVVQLSTQTVRAALEDAEVLLKSSGPMSAVDRIHTALHAFLRNACDVAGLSYASGASLPALLKTLRTSHPKLASSAHRSQDIDRILTSSAGILDAMLAIRNRASLAHANEDLLEEADAVLVISIGWSLLTYFDALLR